MANNAFKNSTFAANRVPPAVASPGRSQWPAASCLCGSRRHDSGSALGEDHSPRLRLLQCLVSTRICAAQASSLLPAQLFADENRGRTPTDRCNVTRTQYSAYQLPATWPPLPLAACRPSCPWRSWPPDRVRPPAPRPRAIAGCISMKDKCVQGAA